MNKNHKAMLLAFCAVLWTGPAMTQGAAPDPGHDTRPQPPPPAVVQARPMTADVTVTDRQLLDADKDQNNWLLHGRTYDNQRFSPLKQISPANVKKLTPVAIIQTGVANSFEDTPTVVNGVMYIITPSDHVQAYDAVTGEPFWTYTPTLAYSDQCCGPQARGVTVAYGKVFFAQLDGIVVALDARTGNVVWKSDPVTTLPSNMTRFSFTAAPQVYDGMVVVGASGAEYPIRGFVQAYDANTGKLVWRFYTIAAPGEPGGDTWAGDSWKVGGGSMWNTPAFDPKSGLISFAVGNPNPDVYGDERKGDNAYTDSIVAVHAKDGTLAWWYQEVKHDVWDYDSTSPVIFLDAKDASGKVVPAAAEANKDGLLYIVNRQTGALIRASDPFVLESANKWVVPTASLGEPHFPSASGGANWSPPAFSPLTRKVYVMGANVAWQLDAKAIDPKNPPPGQWIGGDMRVILEARRTIPSSRRAPCRPSTSIPARSAGNTNRTFR
jgi:alcohol dehydrogenase (cytochrome c)